MLWQGRSTACRTGIVPARFPHPRGVGWQQCQMKQASTVCDLMLPSTLVGRGLPSRRYHPMCGDRGVLLGILGSEDSP